MLRRTRLNSTGVVFAFVAAGIALRTVFDSPARREDAAQLGAERAVDDVTPWWIAPLLLSSVPIWGTAFLLWFARNDALET